MALDRAGQKVQGVGLKLKAVILTFRELASLLCSTSQDSLIQSILNGGVVTVPLTNGFHFLWNLNYEGGQFLMPSRHLRTPLDFVKDWNVKID